MRSQRPKFKFRDLEIPTPVSLVHTLTLWCYSDGAHHCSGEFAGTLRKRTPAVPGGINRNWKQMLVCTTDRVRGYAELDACLGDRHIVLFGGFGPSRDQRARGG